MDPAALTELSRLLNRVTVFAERNLLSLDAVIQAGILAGVFLVSWLLWRLVRERVLAWLARHEMRGSVLAPLMRSIGRMVWPALFVVLAAGCSAALEALGHPSALLDLVDSLLLAWIVIRLSSSFITDRFWARVVAFLVWSATALSVLELFKPTMRLLDNLALTLAEVRITALGVLKALIVLVLAREVVLVIARALERRVERSTLSPAVQVFTVKAARLSLYAMAGLVVLSSMGLNLSSLAFLGGALGVGVGFGLQKIFSNLVSGMILLLDRSIKPGDIIEIGGTVGTIQSLQGRYALLRSLDGKEILVPNEDLISGQVVNWTRSDRTVRVSVPAGVAYSADVRLAMRLMEEAGASLERVLKDPPPRCLLRGFGDSSVDLELGVWIADPENGLWSVKSDALLAIWDRFAQHGIEIPFPQRDLHLKSVPPGFPSPDTDEK